MCFCMYFEVYFLDQPPLKPGMFFGQKMITKPQSVQVLFSPAQGNISCFKGFEHDLLERNITVSLTDGQAAGLIIAKRMFS